MKLEDIKLGIIGLGYVGLPLAVEFSRVRSVVGFDISADRIKELQNGIDSTLEISSDDLLNLSDLSFSNNFKDLENLDKRFNKKNRDVGKLAIAKPDAIQRITNKGSANATRCIEIASGSPLTEEEKNATKKSEINTECPSIANPNYVPY